MLNKYTRGSKWRKWDLHFHTPSSVDYENKSITNNDLISELLENNIEVVAITDHHIIDVKRIKELQTIGKDKITILPGIEFRSELGGSESIHFIGIFPEDSDIDSIWINLQSSCKLTPDNLAKKQKEEIYCDLKETAKIIHENGGLVSVHAGSKSNTIEKITNTLSYKMAIKKDLVTEFIDIYELGQLKDKIEYEEKVFPNLKRIIPMIICSDNHNIKNYQLKESLWIKADATFEGLKQIIYEPEQRLYIGDLPNKLEMVLQEKEFYINSINIKSQQNNDEWFDNLSEIKLNSGLVTIIGNKGSGKSALADIIGMTGNANTDQFSFLNHEKFLSFKNHVKYSSEINFLDGSSFIKKFNMPGHISTINSKVVYLSQSFVQGLCEDLNTSRLQKEIDRVIFSHIPMEEQIGQNNLNDLLYFKNSSINDRIIKEKQKLQKVNLEIEYFEKQLKKDNVEKATNKLKEKQRLLKSVEDSKPPEIIKPDVKPTEDVSKKIFDLKNNIKSVNQLIKQKQTALNGLVIEREEIEAIIDKLKSFNVQFNDIIEEYKTNKVLLKHGLSINDLVKLEIKFDGINKVLRELKGEIKLLKEDNEKNTVRLNVHNGELKKINKTLDEKQKKYQQYLESLDKWEKKKNEIRGDEITKDTILFYEKIINDIKKKLPVKLDDKKKQRTQISENILSLIFDKRNLLPSLYEYAKDYADLRAMEFGVDQGNFITFDSKMKYSNYFENTFLNMINKARKGTFYGKDESSHRFNDIVKNIDVESEPELLKLPEILLKALNFNLTDDPDCKVGIDLDSQLLVSTRSELYNYIYSFDFLEAKFDITFGGVRIQNLSPGERGTLLLIFYLLIDKDRRPIIIDQPEENLDNETVFQKLVPFIKSAKNIRQIILVTHNPNLAIVCDSEQIIYSKIDKKNNNQVNYISGSIEYSQIRDKALDILEGTEPAFKNRKNKYNIA